MQYTDETYEHEQNQVIHMYKIKATIKSEYTSGFRISEKQ